MRCASGPEKQTPPWMRLGEDEFRALLAVASDAEPAAT